MGTDGKEQIQDDLTTFRTLFLLEQILLMEEILHHLGCDVKNLQIMGQPTYQLVQDSFHQQC